MLAAVLRSLLLALAALALAGVAAESVAQTVGPKRWTHQISDVSPDPRVIYGELPNGMRYAVLPNLLPPNAVSIRLAFEFGSLYETEQQRGWAHFIEHLAFNGSRHVDEGEMVHRLERLGLSFGPDVNASTSRKHTIYQFDLPKGSEEALDESLFLLREVASELSFEAGAIDRERGILLAELRQMKSISQRRSDQLLDFLIPGALPARRSPGGDAPSLLRASSEDLRSLYYRYYRPERALLVVVGDVDPETIVSRIEHHFGDWIPRGIAGKGPNLAYAPVDRKNEASVFTDEAGGDVVSIYNPLPYEDAADTIVHRAETDMLILGIAAVNRRLARLAQGADPPFRSAGLSFISLYETVDSASGSVSVRPETWRRGLQVLVQEWQRALQHGFTQGEIDEQLSIMRADRANSASRESTRTTETLATMLLGAILDDAVFATPSSGLLRFEGMASQATPAAVAAVFKDHFKSPSPLLFASTSLKEPFTEADLLETWRESVRSSVDAPAEKAPASFAYGSSGPRGVVVADDRVADIDTRAVVFANNVRLNIKRTTFQKDVVLVSVRIAGGEAALSDAPFGLSLLMKAFAGGGLERHSADDLRSLLAGRAVQASFGISSSAFGGSYVTTAADLRLQLQVAAAYTAHPGYRPEGERRWRDALVASWPEWAVTAPNVLAAQGVRLLASGDRRVGASPDDGVFSRSFVELRAYVTPFLEAGAVEIAIVGDVDEDQAIEDVAKTFGALPERQSAWTSYRSSTTIEFRQSRDPIVLTHGGEANQAYVSLFWPLSIDPDADRQAVRALTAMISVMQLKITDLVRERYGLSYSPTAGAQISTVYPGWGYIVASAEVRPEDGDKIVTALHEIVAELRSGSITKDEFDRALKPGLEQLPGHAFINSYWLSVISELQFRPDRSNNAKLDNVMAGYEALTIEDLVAAASQWLANNAGQEVRIVPQSRAAQEQ